MKQFIKVLQRDGPSYTYLINIMSGISIGKLKAGVFDGPQIRKLMNDPDFENIMNVIFHAKSVDFICPSFEKLSWKS